MSRVPTIEFRGPFLGVNTEINARNIDLGNASDCDNIVVRNGDVTQRPGTEESPGGGMIDDELLSVAYVSGDADYAIAAGKDGVYIQSHDSDYEPRAWTRCPLIGCGYTRGSGALARHGSDSYIAAGDGVLVYRHGLDNLAVEPAGMEPLTNDKQAPTMADAGSGSGMNGTIKLWISRYNRGIDLESNLCEVQTAGGDIELTVTDNEVTLTVTITPGDFLSPASHYRIYHEREDGQKRGLLQEIPVNEDVAGTLTYNLGVNEQNGGVTYDFADDDTDTNYAPCTMNGLPPTNVSAMVYHDGRMFYAAGNYLYYSQAVDEPQGHVESVAASSYLVIPGVDDVVALNVFKESLYIFDRTQIHRLSGNVNSLTNDQVFDGTLEDEIAFTAILEPVDNSVGCVSRDSLIEVETAAGAIMFFCGPNNIYQFDGLGCIPITEKKVGNEYRDRLAATGPDKISAAHYKDQNLILWCFKDNGILAFNYVLGEWVFWDSFTTADGNTAAKLGPVCTRTMVRRNADEPFLLVQENASLDPLASAVFSNDLLTDFGQNFAATWVGPNFDLQLRSRRKRFKRQTVEVERNASGGTAYQQVKINGETATPSDPGNAIDQSKVGPFTLRLGVRAQSVQPVITLAAGKRTRFLGYSLDVDGIGYR